jgi:cytochrome c oxidase assembly protein subunit 15
MTGSGMGCPDWPRCFGYYIPPTDPDQLEWKAFHHYSRGQMIIINDRLLVAVEDFDSADRFEEVYWKRYDKHDYATFVVSHTWIEYINRLLGALSGIPVLLLFFLSLFRVRKDPITFLLSFLALFCLGFVAWLGKLVVDGNLIPHSITYHMFGALALVVLLIAVSFRQRPASLRKWPVAGKVKYLAVGVFVMSLIQIYLGTSVREEVDVLLRELERSMVVDNLETVFYVHRSFSIAVLLANATLLYYLFNARIEPFKVRLLGLLLIVEVFAGVLLNYAGFPAFAQPVHLLAGMAIAALQFFLLLGLSAKDDNQPRAESLPLQGAD